MLQQIHTCISNESLRCSPSFVCSWKGWNSYQNQNQMPPQFTECLNIGPSNNYQIFLISQRFESDAQSHALILLVVCHVAMLKNVQLPCKHTGLFKDRCLPHIAVSINGINGRDFGLAISVRTHFDPRPSTLSIIL